MNLKSTLRSKLTEISSILLEETSKNKDIGVLGGISGIALFHFYCGKFLDDNRHTDKGSDIITEAFDRIQNGYSYPTFCDGIAGAFWVLELLKEEEFIILEEDIVTPELDDHLFEQMNADMRAGNYDFLHGAMGYGFYFLKRYQYAIDKDSKKRYKQYLDSLIFFLKETAIRDTRGIWWKSKIRMGEEKVEGCNLGLSHGISSILNFLSRLAIYPDFYAEVQPLLKPITDYILGCKHTKSELTSIFPNWITPEQSNNYNSRLAWCYGDLGIGISLLRAGKILEDHILLQQAVSILKHTTKRRDLEETFIKDGGICHGAFGVMRIYQYVYKETGNTIFKEATTYWATKALEIATHQNGHAGYKMHAGDSWESEANLLEGTAGIGLSIISYLADFDTKWEEALLIG